MRGTDCPGLPCPLPTPVLVTEGEAGQGTAYPRLSGLQSMYERQGIAVMTPTVPGSPKGPFLGLPRGTMRRQKSIGKKRGLHQQRFCPWGLPTGGLAPGLTHQGAL